MVTATIIPVLPAAVPSSTKEDRSTAAPANANEHGSAQQQPTAESRMLQLNVCHSERACSNNKMSAASMRNAAGAAAADASSAQPQTSTSGKKWLRVGQAESPYMMHKNEMNMMSHGFVKPINSHQPSTNDDAVQKMRMAGLADAAPATNIMTTKASPYSSGENMAAPATMLNENHSMIIPYTKMPSDEKEHAFVDKKMGAMPMRAGGAIPKRKSNTFDAPFATASMPPRKKQAPDGIIIKTCLLQNCNEKAEPFNIVCYKHGAICYYTDAQTGMRCTHAAQKMCGGLCYLHSYNIETNSTTIQSNDHELEMMRVKEDEECRGTIPEGGVRVMNEGSRRVTSYQNSTPSLFVPPPSMAGAPSATARPSNMSNNAQVNAQHQISSYNHPHGEQKFCKFCIYPDGCGNVAQPNSGLCYNHCCMMLSDIIQHRTIMRQTTASPRAGHDIETEELNLAARNTASHRHPDPGQKHGKLLCDHDRERIMPEPAAAIKTNRCCGWGGCNDEALRGGLCRKHGGEKIERLLRGYDSKLIDNENLQTNPPHHHPSVVGSNAETSNDFCMHTIQEENKKENGVGMKKKNAKNAEDELLRVLCSVATATKKEDGNVHEMKYHSGTRGVKSTIYQGSQRNFANENHQSNPKAKGEAWVARMEALGYGKSASASAVPNNVPSTFASNHGNNDSDDDSDDELGAMIYKTSRTAKVRGVEPEKQDMSSMAAQAISTSPNNNNDISELLLATTTAAPGKQSTSLGLIPMGSSSHPAEEVLATSYCRQNNNVQLSEEQYCGDPNLVERARAWVSTQMMLQDNCQNCNLVANPPMNNQLIENGHVASDKSYSQQLSMSSDQKTEDYTGRSDTLIADSAGISIEKVSKKDSQAATLGSELITVASMTKQGINDKPDVPSASKNDESCLKTSNVKKRKSSVKKKQPEKKSTPTATPWSEKKKKLLKFRPYNRYNVFFIFERALIITNQLKTIGDDAKRKEALAHFDVASSIDHDDELQLPPLPPRFAHITAPHKWWIPRQAKPGRRKHRKTHGMASFNGLAKSISTSWKTIDNETTVWCCRVEQILKVKQGSLVRKEVAKMDGGMTLLDTKSELTAIAAKAPLVSATGSTIDKSYHG